MTTRRGRRRIAGDDAPALRAHRAGTAVDSGEPAAPTEATAGSRDAWWGETGLEAGRTGRWAIGPLVVWVHRASREWWLCWRSDPGEESAAADWDVELGATWPDDEELEAARYVFRESAGSVHLAPRAADRPVVVSPRTPLFVPSGEEVTLFVSSPIWVEVAVGRGPTVLRELPTSRPSDTWVGTVREGEPCYALKTSARLDPGELPPVPHRAFTALLIRNAAAEALHLDKVILPVPLLSLWVGPGGALWTEGVTMTRREATEMASLEVQRGAPATVPEARQLAPARQAAGRSLLVRAFGGLFG